MLRNVYSLPLLGRGCVVIRSGWIVPIQPMEGEQGWGASVRRRMVLGLADPLHHTHLPKVLQPAWHLDSCVIQALAMVGQSGPQPAPVLIGR
jgi:hypothetical protein